MKAICLALGALLLLSCGGRQEPPPPEPMMAERMEAESRPRAAAERMEVVAPAPTPMVKATKKAAKKHKIQQAVPAEPQKEAMDTLEVETDTATWVVGKVGVVTVIIAEPQLLAAVGQNDPRDMDIGLDQVPVSAYYLVALEGGQRGQFEILPEPGQQEKQHRAPKGYPATWRYEVTPLKSGQMDLLFTLKVYAEGATAGTAISTRPFHTTVVSRFPKSNLFRMSIWISHNGGWGPILGLLAAGLTALAYTEWWRRNRSARSLKSLPTSHD